MICPGCQAENRAERRFCAKCGGALPAPCPSCAFENDPGDAFCGGCGAALTASPGPSDDAKKKELTPPTAEPERRQVTILFADLSGFTRLSSSLPAEDVHRLMGRFFETLDAVILDYGGSIDKHIGDAVMALFGAPVAHDNDAERAIRAALDIHDKLGELSAELKMTLTAHIGIASGQVVASGIGGAGHGEYTVLGESVNLAARLVDQAGAEETFISDAVYLSVPWLIEADSVGEVDIKGIEKAVKVWRLTGLADAPAARAQTPLFGRRSELTQFQGVLQSFGDTGLGRTVYVRGEAGIGKSRLVDEFTQMAAAEGFACHSSMILDFGAGEGRDCIRSTLHGVLDLPADQDGEARHQALARAVDSGLVDPGHVMFLSDLLDLAQDKEHRITYDAMDNHTRTMGKQDAIVSLLRRLSAETPLLLVIENLHWVDAPALGFLARIAALAATAPVVLVMTSRTEGDPLDSGWRQEAGQAPLLTIDLAPLDEADARAFAQQFVDTTSRFAANCIDRAEGNPLFLEQLLRAAEQIGENDVPGSIRSLVLARMDRLTPRDNQALQAASVLGQRFSAAVVGHLIEDPSWTPEALIRHHLVHPLGQEFLFSHALIWESVYSTPLRDQLKSLHRRAASWFASFDIGLQAEHLDRAGSPNAAAAFLRAAQERADLYHYEQARTFVERGLALVRDRGERHDLTILLGESLRELGHSKESIDAYGQALDAATTDVARCRAWIGLAAGMRVVDAYDQALEILDKAEAVASGDPRLAAELSQIHYYRGSIYFPLGNIEGCFEQHELALQHGRRARSVECETRALSGLGDASYSRGRMVAALNYFRQCVELSESQGLGRIAINNHYMVAWTRLYLMEVEGSAADADRAVGMAEQAGLPRAEMVARLAAGRTLLERADFESARAHLTRGIDIAASLEANRFRPFFDIFLARLDLMEADRRPAVVESLREAVALCRETGIGFVGPWALSTLALASPEGDERAEALAEGERLLADGAVGHNHFAFYADAMEVALEDGDGDEVERHAQSLETFMAAEPLPLSRFHIDRARALADHARDPGGDATRRALRALKTTAEAAQLTLSSRAIDRALESAG